MMTHIDGEKQLREAFTAGRGLYRDGNECPPAERLWVSAQGELDRAGNEQVVLHTAKCPACAEGWRLAYLSVPTSVPIASQPTGHSVWWRRTSLQVVAAMAVMAIALGIGYRSLVTTEPPAGGYRDPASSWLRSSVPEGEVLPRTECLLRWTAGPEGTTYDVRVTTDTLEPLAEVWQIDQPHLLIAAEALAEIPRGSALFWRVTAHPPDGSQVSSHTFRTQIK